MDSRHTVRRARPAAAGRRARRQGRVAGVLALAAILCAGPTGAFADTVRLLNGRTITGIVREQTDTEVVVDLGVGSVRLKRATVASIEKSDAAGRKDVAADWQRRYFAHEQYAPPGCKDVASAFRALSDKRAAAVNASRDLAGLQARERQQSAELARLQEEALAVNRQLRGFRASDVAAAAEYNRLVMTNNAIQAGMAIKQDEMRRNREATAAASDRVSGYLADLSAFEAMLARRATPEAEAQYPAFFKPLRERLAQFGGEFRASEVSVRRDGGTIVAGAVVNGRWNGRFIVDTGAAVMAISQDFARRIGLDLSRAAGHRVVMADGRSADAIPVRLASVQLGDARAEQVEAVVLAQMPSGDVDGLLGMSFLREFAVQVDAASGKLILRSFQPK